MIIYYFTPAHFALVALALQRVKVSRFEDLNDLYELLAVGADNDWHHEGFLHVRSRLNESKGMLCFASNWWNPLLWGHYADKHAGIALGFEVPESDSISVNYVKTPPQASVDTVTGKINFTEDLADQLLRTKFEDWRYEGERRIFVQLDHASRESGLYYLDFSEKLVLREVILGPRCQVPPERIRTILNSLYPGVRLVRSKAAIDAFRVEPIAESSR